MNYDTKAGCARIQTLVDEEIARLSRHIYATSDFLEKLAVINSKSYIEDHRELLGSTPIMKSNRKSAKSTCSLTNLDVSEENMIYTNSRKLTEGTRVENCEEISIITLERNKSPKLIPVYSFESEENEDDDVRIEEVTSDQLVTSVDSSGFVEGNLSSFVTKDDCEVRLCCSQNKKYPTVTTQPDCKDSESGDDDVRIEEVTSDQLVTSVESSGFVEGNLSFVTNDDHEVGLCSQNEKCPPVTPQLDCKDSNDIPEEVSCYPPLPSLLDEFLDSLGSVDENYRDELSKEEMEEKFLTLVLAWTANRKNAEERYQKQSALCQKYKEDFRRQISQTITTLMQRNECDETRTSEDIKRLDSIKQSLDEIFCIAFEYGALQYKMRTNKYWNLIMNYAALLKQELDDNKSLISSTKKIHSQDENENSRTDGELSLKRRKYSKPKEMHVTIISEDYTHLDEVDCVSSWNKLKNIFLIMLLLTIIFLGFTLFVQWQCSRSSLKAPLCPLDYIFKYRRFRFGILPM